MCASYIFRVDVTYHLYSRTVVLGAKGADSPREVLSLVAIAGDRGPCVFATVNWHALTVRLKQLFGFGLRVDFGVVDSA